jgi:hypothetical protein
MGFPLERWRQHFGLHPWHFWQLQNSLAPVSSGCDDLVYEHAWHNPVNAGRAEIREAIDIALARLKEHLGFRLYAGYTEEMIQVRPYWYEPCQWPAVRTCEGYVRELGVEALDFLGLAPITFEDQDGDGLNETFVAILPLPIGSELPPSDEIAVYFSDSDRLERDAANERWQIKPVKVSLDRDANTIIVSGRAWLLGRPALYQRFHTVALDDLSLDPGNSATFAQSLEIYHRYTDSQGTTLETAQAVLIWESSPSTHCTYACQGLDFGGSHYDPAARAYALARGQVRHARLGEVAFGTALYDEDSATWRPMPVTRPPDRILLRYAAGYDKEPCAGRWDEVISRLAASELSAAICSCDKVNQRLTRWRFDRALVATEITDKSYMLSRADLNNPLGTNAGAIYAWKRIKHLCLVRGINI